MFALTQSATWFTSQRHPSVISLTSGGTMVKPGRRTRLLSSLICVLAISAVVAAKGGGNGATAVTPRPGGPNLHEVIPPKYQKRYEEWKAEFLTTDIGKAQWEMYASH